MSCAKEFYNKVLVAELYCNLTNFTILLELPEAIELSLYLTVKVTGSPEGFTCLVQAATRPQGKVGLEVSTGSWISSGTSESMYCFRGRVLQRSSLLPPIQQFWDTDHFCRLTLFRRYDSNEGFMGFSLALYR